MHRFSFPTWGNAEATVLYLSPVVKNWDNVMTYDAAQAPRARDAVIQEAKRVGLR